ncbi:c-type cytochrome [Thioalkalivibrio sp.]|uniref:c-type cytochrome n=1 Tax=Thioalkalivibrio sp. TaxID=2093813 RepID=UPI003975FD2B
MILQRISLSFGILSLALLSACSEPPGDAPGAQDRSAAAPTADEGSATPRREFRIPPEDFQAVPARGADLFAAHCAVCHGDGALGSDQGPPLIHRIYEPSHHADISFYRAVALGVHQHHWEFGDMSPVTGVSGEDTAHIIAWIRREQRAAGIQ